MVKSELMPVEADSVTKVDSRVFMRNPLYDLKTQVKNVTTGERFEAQVKDISGSGIGLVANHEFSRGNIFEISLEIPDGFGPLKLLGRVVWSKATNFFESKTGIMILNPRFMSVSRILKLFF